MWFKNLQLYRLPPLELPLAQFQERFDRLAFQPGDSTELQRQGWVPPAEHTGLVHSVNGQWLIALRSEKKLLPASVVNQVARARAQELEEKQGFKPGRKQMKELKEAVADELRPRAFSLWRDTHAWIDPQRGLIAIDAASVAKCDEMMGLLNQTIDRLGARALHTEKSPVTAMTGWLAADEAPANFTIDEDTELRSPSQTKATVRYVRHAVEPEEVRRHITNGKQCTRLALTWADRVSFVLTESLALKRLAPLDVLKEGGDTGEGNAAERFDADFTLMTGEVSVLVEQLIEALGGEKAL
ncbi:MAG: recombination-associated protein RdgC [Pigmentiphaga sp.]